MKKGVLFLSVLVVVFLSSYVTSLAYDATGTWNYTEHSHWNNCDYPQVPESGEVGILQTGSTFLIVDDDFSTYGNVNGNTYTYSDKFCEEGGVASVNVSITLTSETSATGTASWSWSGGGESCSGGHQITLSKQTQAEAVHDATGKWNFAQSGFSSNCGSATTPRSSGYFEVTQTGNKISAVDDKDDQYSGFVNGAQYAVVRSYLNEGGRETQWIIITLSSGTQGSGTGHFVWDDDCDDCNGSWTIWVTKEISTHTITASAGPGGSISPSGEVSVEDGETQTFWFTPDPGYMVVSILFDGELYEAKNWEGCEVYDVADDHTLKVIFERIRTMPWLPLLLDDSSPPAPPGNPIIK